MTFLDRTVSLLFVDELSHCSILFLDVLVLWEAEASWFEQQWSSGDWGGLRWFGDPRWPWAGNLGRGFLAPGFSFTLGFNGMWHTQIYIYIYDIICIYILYICNSITFTTTIWHLYIYQYRYHHTQCAAQELVQLNSKAGPQGKWGLEQRATGDLTNRTRP